MASLLGPALRQRVDPVALAELVTTMREGLRTVYAALVAVAAAGFVSALFFPGGSAAEHAHDETAARLSRE